MAIKSIFIISHHLLVVSLDGKTPIHLVAQLQWNQRTDKVVFGKVENGLIFLLHASGNICILAFNFFKNCSIWGVCVKSHDKRCVTVSEY